MNLNHAFIMTTLLLPLVMAKGQGPARYAQDRVIIRFKQNAIVDASLKRPADPRSFLLKKLDVTPVSHLEDLPVARGAGKSNNMKAKNGKPVKGSHMLLHLPPSMSPAVCIAKLKNHPMIEYVEPDHILTIGATYPSETDYEDQWHLHGQYHVPNPPGRIRAPEAWDITQGSTNIIIAVVDTGCDTNILEFTGRTVPGHDFANNDHDPDDDHGHGTAVAATACANANNATNGVGLDWNCKLMPVKVLDENGSGYASDIASGINYATTSGAHVINLSASMTSSNNTLYTSITNAIAHGVIFVTITGNETNSSINYPGRFPETIAVGSNDTDGSRSDFSNYGTQIDLVAPGYDIYTSSRSGTWSIWEGTSLAAPQVAAAASLILSVRPGLNNEQVRSLLNAGAEDQPSSDTDDTDGYDLYYGWGVLNVYNSLILAQTYIEEFNRDETTGINVSWQCPPNASEKKPQIVRIAPTITGHWTTSTGITYNGTTASWSDTNMTVNMRFYRVSTKPFTPE